MSLQNISPYEELKLLYREIAQNSGRPKFILWLITDPIYGLLNNIDDTDLLESVKSKIPLYEEWIHIGRKPDSIEREWNSAINGKITIRDLEHGLSIGSTNYICRMTVNICKKVKLGESNESVVIACKNKIKDLIAKDALFSWEDYEKV